MSKTAEDQKLIRRKIQVVGGNTITVSLPRAWAKKNRLGKAVDEEQEISMRQHPDGSLIISPANAQRYYVERVRTHVVSPGTGMGRLMRILIADYVAGMDIIRLHMKKTLPIAIHHELQNFVDKRMIGFDMIDMENSIEVTNMASAPKFDVQRLMEIIRVQSTKMVSNCYTWIADDKVNSEELYELMNDWETIIDRQSNQMMRTLQLSIFDFWMAEKVNLPMSEILYWSAVNKAAESAADLAVAISAVGPMLGSSNISARVSKDLRNLGDKSNDLFSRAMKSFITADYEEAHRVLKEQGKSSATIQQKWPIEAVEGLSTNITLVMRHLEKIGSYARKIAEATIDCESARIAYQS
ncbi:MAG: hypothetical protein ACXAD7_18270 [Candidatus Kariarchaeaceae archaeon]